MARTRELKVVIAGDAGKLDKELKRGGNSLDKFGKQTRLTGTVTSKGFSAMRVGATGAAAALGGLALAGKGVASAYIEAEKSEARLQAQLKASGLSYNAHAAAIERSIKATSQLSGLDDEDLADSFTNIVRVTGDVNEALRLNALAADFARAKSMDVAKAGELVGKVAGGNIGVLSRYGITVKEGATAQEALAEMQARFAGQAEAYGKTTGGAVDRAKVAYEGLQETVGEKLAPAIEKGADKLATFVDEMSSGTGSGGRFVDTLSAIWEEAKPIVTWIGRATKNVAGFVKEHPNVGKLAAAIIGVGTAVKTLKFASAATGFTDLLKLGRGAMKRLVGIFAAQGAAAGAAAGTASAGAEGIAGQTGSIRRAGKRLAARLIPQFAAQGAVAGATAGAAAAGGEGLTSAASFGKVRRAGGRLGKVGGRALGVGMVAGILLAFPEIYKKIDNFENDIRDKLFDVGKSIGRKLGIGDGIGKGLAAGASIGAVGGAVGSLAGANSALRPLAAVGARHGLRVSSGLRPGAITSSGNTSYHGSGEAVDLAGPPAGMMRTFRQLKSTVGGRLAELIYTPGGVGIRNGRPHRYSGQVASDHYDHVHVALDLGRPGPGIGDGAGHLGTGDGYGKGQIMSLWTKAGGSSKVANLAAAVALAESGGESNASNRNSDGSIDRGLWQINSIHGNLSTFNPMGNARAAVKISGGGRNWSPWVAWKKGMHKQFLDDPAGASRGGSGSSARSSANSEKAGSRIVNAIAGPAFSGKRGISSLLRIASGRERVISEKETAYGQAERRFGQSEEELGTAEGRAKRTSELAELAKLKTAQLKRQQTRLRALVSATKKLDGVIKRLRAKLKGKRRLKGAAAARVRERLREYEDRRIDLAAEARSLGSEIEDTKLDLGDLANDAAEVAATPNTEGAEPAPEPPSAQEIISQNLSDIDLQERAGLMSPEAAKQRRLDTIAHALKGGYGALDQRQTWELMAQQIEVTGQQTQATSDLAAEMKALREETARANAIAESTLGTQMRELTKAFADLVNGQLGQKVASRGYMPGDGQLSRLAPSVI